MHDENIQNDKISIFFKNPENVTQALQKGINDALLKHKKLGFPVCAWKDGKVVWIPPEKIKINNEP